MTEELLVGDQSGRILSFQQLLLKQANTHDSEPATYAEQRRSGAALTRELQHQLTEAQELLDTARHQHQISLHRAVLAATTVEQDAGTALVRRCQPKLVKWTEG